MADNRWEPKAGAVAQVDTVTVANTWAQNDTVTLTINSSDLLITIGTLTSTSQVATTIQQAWEGLTFTDTSASVVPEGGGDDFAEHGEITATVSSAVVTLTHDTPGRPFLLTVTEVTGGSGTATEATATAATGPNHADNTANWTAGTLPQATASENVFIDNSDVSLLYGLDGWGGANTLDSFTIAASFTGDIGLPKLNPAGYVEYDSDYLDVEATKVFIGNGEGTGSGRIKLNMGTVLATVTVESTGSPAESGLGALILKGTNTNNVLEVLSGSVSIAAFGGETANLVSSRIVSGTVDFGEGLVATTLIQNQQGNITVRSNMTTLTNSGGTVAVLGSATVGTLNNDAGTVNYLSSGTITNLNIGGKSVGAHVAFSGDLAAGGRTVTNCTIDLNGSFRDDLQTVAFTNKIGLGSGVSALAAT